MKQSVLMYGTVSGIVIIVTSILSIELGIASAWLGFLVIFVVFSSIFVAVRRHRDEVLDGLIPFGTALWSGLGITLIASLGYRVGCQGGGDEKHTFKLFRTPVSPPNDFCGNFSCWSAGESGCGFRFKKITNHCLLQNSTYNQVCF